MSFVVFLAGWLVLAVLVLLAMDWLRDRAHRQTPEERRESTVDFERRLVEPDWDAVARYLGRPAPDALRALYEDAALVRRSDFVVRDPRPDASPTAEWDVGYFQPAGDEQPDWPEELGIPPRSFCFAWTRSGDPYMMLPSERSDGDGPVMLAPHDGDVLLAVAPRLSEFLAWARTSG